jgi:hypothetical protein
VLFLFSVVIVRKTEEDNVEDILIKAVYSREDMQHAIEAGKLNENIIVVNKNNENASDDEFDNGKEDKSEELFSESSVSASSGSMFSKEGEKKNIKNSKNVIVEETEYEIEEPFNQQQQYNKRGSSSSSTEETKSKPSESLVSPQFSLKKNDNFIETQQSVDKSENEEEDNNNNNLIKKFIIPKISVHASYITDSDTESFTNSKKNDKKRDDSEIDTERDAVKDLYQINNSDLDNWYKDVDFKKF